MDVAANLHSRTFYANVNFYAQARVIEGCASSGAFTLEPWNLAPECVRVLPIQLSACVEPAEGGAQVIAFKCLHARNSHS